MDDFGPALNRFHSVLDKHDDRKHTQSMNVSTHHTGGKLTMAPRRPSLSAASNAAASAVTAAAAAEDPFGADFDNFDAFNDSGFGSSYSSHFDFDGFVEPTKNAFLNVNGNEDASCSSTFSSSSHEVDECFKVVKKETTPNQDEKSHGKLQRSSSGATSKSKEETPVKRTSTVRKKKPSDDDKGHTTTKPRQSKTVKPSSDEKPRRKTTSSKSSSSSTPESTASTTSTSSTAKCSIADHLASSKPSTEVTQVSDTTSVVSYDTNGSKRRTTSTRRRFPHLATSGHPVDAQSSTKGDTVVPPVSKSPEITSKSAAASQSISSGSTHRSIQRASTRRTSRSESFRPAPRSANL